MSSAALVGTDGSVDWCCFPRFDSPSVFAAILDQKIGGYFRISPAGSGFESSQRYIPDTNILETTFTGEAGEVSITDFMPLTGDNDGDPDTPPPDPPHEIHRIAACISGQVELRCDFRPRHDYARAVPDFRPLRCDSGGAAVQVGGGRQTMTLLASIPCPWTIGASPLPSPHPGRDCHLRPGLRQWPPHQPGAPPDPSQAGPDRQLLEEPGGAHELRRTMARAGCPLLPRAAPDDVPPHRGHRRGPHHQPARDHWRLSKLGLPLLLAARRRLYCRHPLPPRRRLWCRPLHPLAAGAV